MNKTTNRKARRARVTDDEKKAIRKMRGNGSSAESVGQHFSLSTSSVHRVTREVMPTERTKFHLADAKAKTETDRYADASKLIREALDDVLGEFERHRKIVKAMRDLLAKFGEAS